MLVPLLLLGGCAGLPSGGERPVSTALKAPPQAPLPALVRSCRVGHAGQSGLHPLGEPHDALAARLALIDRATRSLDVQYFIWNKDLTGRLMVDRLLRAADRGVRVRVLLDDLGSMTDDAVLLAFDHHPRVEVRLFNPVAFRTFRVLGMAADLGRINRRMHNKSFTADGVISIVGGRNIGDEYFAAHEASNFADLDVAVIGPVVDEVSGMFDLYWNHRASVPVTALARRSGTREQLEARRAVVESARDDAAASAYGAAVRDSAFARQMRAGRLGFYWGRAWVVSDHPDKVLTPESDTSTHLAPRLREDIRSVTREMFLVSPYFVPRTAGVASLASVRRRGARVVVVTNSLASTDGLPVHSAYQRYRKALVRAGIELYEIRPDPGAPSGGRGSGLRGWSGSGGSSGAA